MNRFDPHRIAAVLLVFTFVVSALGNAKPSPSPKPNAKASAKPSPKPTATPKPKKKSKGKAGNNGSGSKNATTVKPRTGREGTTITITYPSPIPSFPLPQRAEFYDAGVHGWVIEHGAGVWISWDGRKQLHYFAPAQVVANTPKHNVYTAVVPYGICGIVIKPKQATVTSVPAGIIQSSLTKVPNGYAKTNQGFTVIGQNVARYPATAKPTKNLEVWLDGQKGVHGKFGLTCDSYSLQATLKAEPKRVKVPPKGTSTLTGTFTASGPAQFINGKRITNPNKRPTLKIPFNGLSVYFHVNPGPWSLNPPAGTKLMTNTTGQVQATISSDSPGIAQVQVIATGLGDANAPVEFYTPKPPPTPAPLAAVMGIPPAIHETAYLPEIAGPGSTIVATFEDPQAGPSGKAMVAFEDPSGHRSYLHVITNAAHKVAFKVAEGAVAIWLFKHLDSHGDPDVSAVKTVISRDAVVNGTESVSNVARTGPAIERAETAYERGGASGGIFNLQTRGIDPHHAHVVVDGNSLGASTLAASNRSLKARFADNEPLGRHSLAVVSGNQRSNAVQADLVTMRADPFPPSKTGTVRALRVHVEGVPSTDRAVMYFHIAGSARLENGGEDASVPVTNGIAEVRIRGEHAGPALVSFTLHAMLDVAGTARRF